MSQPTVKEVKQIDCDKLSNKLKKQLIEKLNVTEQAAIEQAERIAAIFRQAQTN